MASARAASLGLAGVHLVAVGFGVGVGRVVVAGLDRAHRLLLLLLLAAEVHVGIGAALGVSGFGLLVHGLLLEGLPFGFETVLPVLLVSGELRSAPESHKRYYSKPTGFVKSCNSYSNKSFR